jgi:RNA polymerase sigma-70 factor (ECF subfamily)
MTAVNRRAAERDTKSGRPPQTPRGTTDPATGDTDARRLFAAYRMSRSVELAEQVYRLATPRLRIYAATLVQDPNDIDDLVQEALLSALERPESWQVDRPLLPWLGGILRNLVLNRRRSERRRRIREAAARPEAHLCSDPLDRMGAAEVFRAIETGIEGLPPTYRSVVADRVLGGASSAEIARGLGRAENTVRVQLRRGLQMLREALPVGIGAALAVALTPGSALAASGAASLGTGIRQAATRSARLRTLRRLAALAAAAVLPLGAWAALRGPGDAPPAPVERETLVALSPIDVRRDDLDPRTGVPTPRTSIAEPTQTALEIELSLDGAPAAGATVSIERVDDRGLLVTLADDRYGLRREFTVPGPDRHGLLVDRSDAEGRVRFATAAGRYLVRVPGNGVPVELGADGRRRIRFDLSHTAAAIACRVVDAGGRPLAAEIWSAHGVEDSALVRVGSCDADGRFAGVLTRGAIVQARLGRSASAQVLARPGQGEIRLTLEPAGELVGEVRGPDGRPVAAAIVELADGRAPSRTETGADGRFRIAGARPGRWSIRARSDQRPLGHASGEARILADGTAETALDLLPTATISGRIRDPLGRPAPRVLVRTGWSSEELDAVVGSTDAEGRFELSGVAPGPLRISAGLGHDGFAQASLHARPGQFLTWDAVLSADDLRLAGRIAPVPAGTDLVIAFDTDDHFKPATAAVRDGTFDLLLPPTMTGRQLSARVYRADSLERHGIRASMPIAVRHDVATGARDLELELGGSVDPRGAVSARIVAPWAGYAGSVRLNHRGLDHWIEVGRFGGTEPHLDIRAERLPSGTYALTFDPECPAIEFELGPDQQLALGDLLPRPADRSASARTEVEILFRHPGDATPMSRLEVEVRGADGQPLARQRAPGRDGSWSVQLALEPGPVTIAARTLNGLSGTAAWLVPAAGPRARVEVPLERALERELTTR